MQELVACGGMFEKVFWEVLIFLRKHVERGTA